MATEGSVLNQPYSCPIDLQSYLHSPCKCGREHIAFEGAGNRHRTQHTEMAFDIYKITLWIWQVAGCLSFHIARGPKTVEYCSKYPGGDRIT